jgi:hypothetical protein
MITVIKDLEYRIGFSMRSHRAGKEAFNLRKRLEEVKQVYGRDNAQSMELVRQVHKIQYRVNRLRFR